MFQHCSLPRLLCHFAKPVKLRHFKRTEHTCVDSDTKHRHKLMSFFNVFIPSSGHLGRTDKINALNAHCGEPQSYLQKSDGRSCEKCCMQPSGKRFTSFVALILSLTHKHTQTDLLSHHNNLTSVTVHQGHKKVDIPLGHNIYRSGAIEGGGAAGPHSALAIRRQLNSLDWIFTRREMKGRNFGWLNWYQLSSPKSQPPQSFESVVVIHLIISVLLFFTATQFFFFNLIYVIFMQLEIRILLMVFGKFFLNSQTIMWQDGFKLSLVRNRNWLWIYKLVANQETWWETPETRIASLAPTPSFLACRFTSLVCGPVSKCNSVLSLRLHLWVPAWPTYFFSTFLFFAWGKFNKYKTFLAV